MLAKEMQIVVVTVEVKQNDDRMILQGPSQHWNIQTSNGFFFHKVIDYWMQYLDILLLCYSDCYFACGQRFVISLTHCVNHERLYHNNKVIRHNVSEKPFRYPKIFFRFQKKLFFRISKHAVQYGCMLQIQKVSDFWSQCFGYFFGYLKSFSDLLRSFP